MTAQALVSVIVIFLDERRFIEEAIESLRNQTYGHWELLLVDDGSTDGSAEIALRHVALYPGRVRYLQHPGGANRGMSASRNLGLAHVGGDYVGFLDADDIWRPGKLEEQLALLQANPRASMIYGRTLLWHSWRGADHEDGYCELGVEPDRLVEPPTLLLNLLRNQVQTPTTCNALMRRSVFDRVGGFEDRFRGMFEDQFFFMKVCLEENAYVSSRTWALYRQRSDSCSARAEQRGEVGMARRQLLAWLECHLRARHITDRNVWKALRREKTALRWPLLARIGRRLTRA